MRNYSKSQLRSLLLKQRRSLSLEQWREKSDRLCSFLQSSPIFSQAKTILAYFSFRQEPDLSPLFEDNHKWGFSRCIGNSLSWHMWQPGEALETSHYGILEPHPDSPIINPFEVDLILVPALACDLRGYRLGYGGGYYDRLLSLPDWSIKPSMGIVFESAYLPQLPIDNWDRPLSGVFTEMGLKMIPSKL